MLRRIHWVLTRLLTSALVAIVALGLAMRPSTVAWASVSCDGMAICDPCDLMPGGCTHALACLKVIPSESAAQISDPGRNERVWTPASHHLAGVEVPPEQPPPIVVRESS